MSSLKHSWNLDRIQNVEVTGPTAIPALEPGIDVLRVTLAINTPQMLGISGGAARRFVLLVNATSVNISLVTDSPSAPSGTRFIIPNTSLAFAAEFCVFLWYDVAWPGWRVLG